ncbi:general stress protein CsbD [Rhodothermus marinus]|uniref:general stress protein CsbD n=1 Tax=Rhodothermus marinus TaxID=29549 RepID=UPI0037C93FAE
MATRQMEESWERTKEQIRIIWGDILSDQELQKARGDLHTMVALIHEKTGESREEILQKMDAIL